jgi:acyl carrier protein
MAVTASDVIVAMKEAGIDPAIVGRLKLDAPLLHQGLDSIDLPVIAVTAEKKYGVDLSDADATKLRSVNDFVVYLNQKLG